MRLWVWGCTQSWGWGSKENGCSVGPWGWVYENGHSAACQVSSENNVNVWSWRNMWRFFGSSKPPLFTWLQFIYILLPPSPVLQHRVNLRTKRNFELWYPELELEKLGRCRRWSDCLFSTYKWSLTKGMCDHVTSVRKLQRQLDTLISTWNPCFALVPLIKIAFGDRHCLTPNTCFTPLISSLLVWFSSSHFL